MIELIKLNKFEELKDQLNSQLSDYTIYKFLLDILSNKKVEIDGESFDARSYQEEFSEGLELYIALSESQIDELRLDAYKSVLVQLSFKMGGFIKLMANTAMQNAAYLSEIKDLYSVKPEIRAELQKFIDMLKLKGKEDKAIANISAAKAQISNAIGNTLQKYEIGEDMLQLAESYKNLGETEMATKLYGGIMMDFKRNTAQSPKGLFSKNINIDSRSEKEIEIDNIATKNFFELIGEEIPVEDDVQQDNGFFSRIISYFRI